MELAAGAEQPVPETEEEILNRIFIGDFENLPSLASKIVRIFTSSTFTGDTNNGLAIIKILFIW
jgi:hypothetical protein